MRAVRELTSNSRLCNPQKSNRTREISPSSTRSCSYGVEIQRAADPPTTPRLRELSSEYLQLGEDEVLKQIPEVAGLRLAWNKAFVICSACGGFTPEIGQPYPGPVLVVFSLIPLQQLAKLNILSVLVERSSLEWRYTMEGIFHGLKSLCDKPSQRSCFKEIKYILAPLESHLSYIFTSPLILLLVTFLMYILLLGIIIRLMQAHSRGLDECARKS